MVLSPDYYLYDMTFYSQSTAFYILLYHLLFYRPSFVIANSHLDLGVQFLAKGQIQEALTQFHSAVEEEPTEFMPYYRRATAYLALGKGKAALNDLNSVLQYRPDFQAARTQRANILTKFGEFDNALVDLDFIVSNSKDDKSDILLKMEHIKELSAISTEVEELYTHDKDYRSCLAFLDRLVDECPWNVRYREQRSHSFIAIEEPSRAIFDLKQLTKLINDNTEGFMKLSFLYYQLGEDEQSLSEIRECLRLDPDQKSCFDHYKKVKKLNKQLTEAQTALDGNDYALAMTKFDSALKTEPSVIAFRNKVLPKKCKCFSKSKQAREAIALCTEAIQVDESDADVFVDRAEAYLLDERWEDAIKDYEKAVELNEDSRAYKQGLDRARKLFKQSQRRDYYKILGVKRTATKQEVNKAYRKLAQEWHPDNFQLEEEKASAEKKFMDIAAAKEVLSDDELRQKFDNGEDPLDPEQQKNQGGHPFHHGGGFPFNFGGGGFKFKF
jgi:DnaJ family protein C protein 3